ncbi:PIN-like domain-containing protein [Rhizobium leguminosarum]
MRDSFSGFYALSEGDFDKLWQEALIVLDANAILDLYRLPPMARDDFFEVLEYYKTRLWIPFQVGLEVQRNRFRVIADRQKSTDAALKEVNAAFANLKSTVQNLKLERYKAPLNPEAILNKFEAPLTELSEAIREAKKEELKISAEDPVRDRIDKIFEGRVGPAPSSQEEVDQLNKEGERRFQNEVPPGFLDAVKKDQSFTHDGIRYLSKFGDLILWTQLLNYIKNDDTIKSVMLVTSEKKPDWWWRVTEGGNRILGPHPELKAEITKAGSVDLFWMYSADDFLERSAKYRNEEVAETSVQELRDIVNRDETEATDNNELNIFSDFPPNTGRAPDWVLAGTNPLIGTWLQSNRGDVSTSIYGPDFTVTTPDGVEVGYMVVRIPHFLQSSHIPREVVDRVLSVKNSINVRREAHIALVVLIGEKPVHLLKGTRSRDKIKAILKTWATAIGLAEIILGTIADHQFHFIMEYPEPGDPPSAGASIFD